MLCLAKMLKMTTKVARMAETETLTTSIQKTTIRTSSKVQPDLYSVTTPGQMTATKENKYEKVYSCRSRTWWMVEREASDAQD
jgi:hypothetical protein